MKSYAKLKLVTCSVPQAYEAAGRLLGFGPGGRGKRSSLLDSCSKLVGVICGKLKAKTGGCISIKRVAAARCR